MLKGSLLIFLQAACYACLPIFIRLTYRAENIAPLDVVTWRFMVAVSIAWVMMLASSQYRILGSLSREQIVTLLILGALFSVAGISAAFALERVSATTYTLLLYTYPAMVAVLSVILGERLPISKWGAVGLALLGCALTVSGPVEARSTLDLSLPLINAVAVSFYLVAMQRYNRVSGLPSGAISMVGTLGVLLGLALGRGLHPPTTTDGWLAILGLGSISTALPIVLMFAGLAYVGAANAAILSTIEPVMVVILAALLLNEHITGLQVIGGALIIISVILLHIPVRRRRHLQTGNVTVSS